MTLVSTKTCKSVISEGYILSYVRLICHVRMAEWSKALRSGRSPLLWAWVRIPLLTLFFVHCPNCLLRIGVFSQVIFAMQSGRQLILIIIIIVIIIFIIIMYFFCLIEISVIDPAEYKLPSIREICICMLVYKYENEVLKQIIILAVLVYLVIPQTLLQMYS